MTAPGLRPSATIRRPSAARGGIRGLLLAAAVLYVAFLGFAKALVGGAQVARGEIARQVVMITDARGTNCSGTMIAGDVVITAAHCTKGTTALVVSRSVDTGARSRVVAVAVHPDYDARSVARSVAAVDLALLKLESPLSVPRPAVMRERVPLPGESFVVAGFGVTAAGSRTGLGTLHTTSLVAVGEPSSLQLQLADPASRGRPAAGLGSCDGDSGGPAFERKGGRLVLIGVLSWSNGPAGSAGCGGVTGVTPLANHREWIIETAEMMGARVNYEK